MFPKIVILQKRDQFTLNLKKNCKKKVSLNIEIMKKPKMQINFYPFEHIL